MQRFQYEMCDFFKLWLAKTADLFGRLLKLRYICSIKIETVI